MSDDSIIFYIMSLLLIITPLQSQSITVNSSIYQHVLFVVMRVYLKVTPDLKFNKIK